MVRALDQVIKLRGSTRAIRSDNGPEYIVTKLTMRSQVEIMGKTVETMGKKINRDQTVIEKLTHEIAQLKRLKFARRSEQMNPEQASLLEDLIDTDIAAIEAELQALQTVPATTEKK